MIIVLGSSIHFHKLVFEINFEIYVSNTDFSLVSSLFAEEKKKKKNQVSPFYAFMLKTLLKYLVMMVWQS